MFDYKDLVAFIKASRETATDEVALKAKELYKEWTVGKAVAVGERYRYGDRLYKVVQAHTTQADWTPDITPAMWAVIDETHAGTLEDPIPAIKGMEYTKGLYYIEDGKIYLMNRKGMADGEKIILQYVPSELVGQYFELV
jgi:hypothetical protein